MKLTIEPLKALCDERIGIVVSELPPSGKVKISASMRLPWAPNTKFESSAWYTADEQGIADLSRQRPEAGAYGDIDAMGLITSLKMTAGKLKDIEKNISVDHSMRIDFTAECESGSTSVTAERLFINPEIKREKIEDGFVGELFYTENTGKATILVLGGSDGNSSALALVSALLASRGFNVLSLAYFNEKGLPKALAEIPLEYFESVFRWLEKNLVTSGGEIYIHGTSKGGELALLLASRYPAIKKVTAFAPHGYCFQGLNFKNVSSWTYRGKGLPFIRLKNSILFADIINCMIKNKPFGYTHTYKKALNQAANREEARIRLEHAQAHLLLIAGREDNIWNSWEGCNVLMNDLERYGHQFEREFLAFENAGHPFPLPYMIPNDVLQSVKAAPRLTLAPGGTIEGNTRMQEESWEKTIKFFLE